MSANRAGLSLLGRERELRKAQTAVAASPAVVLLSGEAGIGKTTSAGAERRRG